jgi:HAD superfamily phosphoserine phosphatase-like hydrolase
MSRAFIGLAVFDLDGTLLRGPTVCEVLAESLGRLERMRQLEAFASEAELKSGREEMATWYRGIPSEQLTVALEGATLAPGAVEGIELLRERGVAVAIASITWRFAVEWFARRLAVEHCLGTGLSPTGRIEHVWPRDKARWAKNLADRLGVPPACIAAVGDSAGDAEILLQVAHPVFVGARVPSSLKDVTHLPNVDVMAVAQWILGKLVPGVTGS